jgi:Xaa-Pro aminopeptidase
VHTLHPTLLIGPSDWDEARMPRAEFARRIAAMWELFPEACGAIVYGTPAHHGELAFLTNFVPKLEPALALIAREGAPRLLVGGGPNMMGAARPLTWIEDVSPLRDAPGEIRRRFAAHGGEAGPPVLIGADHMTAGLRRGVVAAVGEGGTFQDATGALWSLMRRKSPAELDAIRTACSILGAAMAAIGMAKRSGAGVTAAMLAGERAANVLGAQDVRTLFSVNGGRTLQPFETLIERAVEPLQVYVAVRRSNYWVEGFATFSERPSPAADKAAAALRAAVAAIRPGVKSGDIASMIEESIQPYRTHPITEHAFAAAMGTGLDEARHAAPGDAFAAGEVYSLGVGVSDGAEQHGILSAMIGIWDQATNVLWSAGDMR